MNFRSNDVSVFPTAYRQYEDTNSQTQIVDIEARLNTEYNITNLVNGLLDERMNSGNFVVDYDSIQHTIKFCLKGYYFEIRNLQGYDNITPLYVKINIEKFNESTYKNLYELVPMSYEAGTNRNLDKLESNQLSFIGLDFVNSETTGYFQLLDGNGNVPEKSWLRFSTRQIGYFNGENWVSINTNFFTATLQATTSFISPNILEDTSSSFKIKGVNNNNETSLGIIVNGNGKIVSNDQSYDFTATNDSYTFISSIKTNGTGKITNTGTKTIPTDTSEFTNDNDHLPTSKLVKTKLDAEASARSTADTTLQTNITNEANARSSADTTLQNNINSEASARSNADTTLQTNINNEATARANADSSLDGKISTEATTRENADSGLSSRIDTNASSITRLNNNKINKTDLTFSYSNGILTITKSY